MKKIFNPQSLMLLTLALLILLYSPRAFAQETRPCPFTGTPLEQAKCLLRPVAKLGNVAAAPRATLPAPLDRLIGQPVTVSKTALKTYLAAHSIREADIGGALSDPVSRTSDGKDARYFIIHDTSDPTLPRGAAFPPAGMDTAAWSGNDLRRFLPPRAPQPVAHVFINRLGQSVTGHDFKQGWRSTRYEGQTTLRRGLFLAVENIQPRRRDEHGIDSEAPDPGLSDAQLDRLALVYVAASVRRGEWLIPVFHAVMDINVGTHDDPQNFDLERWAARLDSLLESINTSGGAGTDNGAETGGNADGSGALPADAVERVKAKYTTRLRNARYMEQNCEPTTRAGYEDLPLTKCNYSVRDHSGAMKTATVVLLDPPVEQLARWIVHTCLQVKGNANAPCTDKLFDHIIGQSGGQFPVAGIVYEDILPEDGVNEIYCFRDGVTVRISGVTHRGTVQPTATEIEQSLNGEILSSFVFARLQGTMREQYKANGGTVDVGTSEVGKRKLEWLSVSRDLYKAAWGHDRNELMIAWARREL